MPCLFTGQSLSVGSSRRSLFQSNVLNQEQNNAEASLTWTLLVSRRCLQASVGWLFQAGLMV